MSRPGVRVATPIPMEVERPATEATSTAAAGRRIEDHPLSGLPICRGGNFVRDTAAVEADDRNSSSSRWRRRSRRLLLSGNTGSRSNSIGTSSSSSGSSRRMRRRNRTSSRPTTLQHWMFLPSIIFTCLIGKRGVGRNTSTRWHCSWGSEMSSNRRTVSIISRSVGWQIVKDRFTNRWVTSIHPVVEEVS